MQGIKIDLPKGGSLYVKTTPDFMKKIKEHYSLDDNQEITHQHIRMYIYGAFKSAVDKAERELIK